MKIKLFNFICKKFYVALQIGIIFFSIYFTLLSLISISVCTVVELRLKIIHILYINKKKFLFFITKIINTNVLFNAF